MAVTFFCILRLIHEDTVSERINREKPVLLMMEETREPTERTALSQVMGNWFTICLQPDCNPGLG